ncbi:hypothetical protein [Paenibacillus alkalitolerans]|uniref:hypothetical protein n=1 Tax=Paenibacillus alkalitolerans TaxID=2799335 RepID=UPI0018F30E48|nr:hypothetical protein [Paenibacillus alkalitolerans]
MSKETEYLQALLEIREIVTRKYIIGGSLAKIHDVLERFDLDAAQAATDSTESAQAE